MKLQFLQRLEEKGLIKLNYAGTSIQSYQVINQIDLGLLYYKYTGKIVLTHDRFRLVIGNQYLSNKKISPDDFIQKLNSPQLKQELLFNLDLLK